jgi:integrase
MALSGQKTTSDYIEWDKLQNLILKLERDGDSKFALLLAIGSYTGLRISDILNLRWNDIVDKDLMEVSEKKTGKFRRIKMNPHLIEIIERTGLESNFVNIDNFVFLNRFGTSTISTQYVNRKLKLIAKEYKLCKDPHKIKSHSMRKSFGRRVWENNENSDKSLILLSEMFNHSNIKTTKVYLGIREKEIFDVYDNI